MTPRSEQWRSRVVPSPALIGALSDVALVLDCLPRAVIVTDLDGVIAAWNVQATAVYGWGIDAVRGRFVADVLDPGSDPGEFARFVDRVIAQNGWTGTRRIETRERGVRTVLIFMQVLRDGAGIPVGMVGAAEDATDAARLRRGASEMTDRLVLALSAGGLGTFRWDMATGATDWDAVTEKVFGLEPGTFDGRFETYVELLHPDDRQATLGAVASALSTRRPYEVSHRVVWPDGSVHWLHGRGQVTVNDDGEATGVVGCVGDDTERRQAMIEADQRAARAEQLARSELLLRQRLEFLSEFNRAAVAADDHIDLMRRVATAAVPRLGDWCAIHFLVSPDATPLVEVAHSDPARVAWARELQRRFPYDPNSSTGVAAVIRSGRTEFIEELDESTIRAAIAASPGLDEEAFRAALDVLGVTSAVTVPLTTRTGIIGAVQFVSAESKRRYDSDDVTLAEASAALIAEALQSAWRAAHEREVSSTLQAALLPSHLPDIDGISLSVVYRAGQSMEVGGDFYDVFRIAGNRIALAIGDVCGTGPDAAAVTAKARHTIRAAATHGAAPIEVLRWLNDAIIAGDRRRFCTALYATLEPLAGGRWRLTSVAGGHPLPLLYRAAGNTTSLIGTPGTLLGFFQEVQFTEMVTLLEPGDTLVLYTDGVTDVPPPFALDNDAVVALVQTAASGSTDATTVTSKLLGGIEAVLPISRRHDDMALLVVRIADSPTEDPDRNGERNDATWVAPCSVPTSQGSPIGWR